jgi:uncharacterized membrane protein
MANCDTQCYVIVLTAIGLFLFTVLLVMLSVMIFKSFVHYRVRNFTLALLVSMTIVEITLIAEATLFYSSFNLILEIKDQVQSDQLLWD